MTPLKNLGNGAFRNTALVLRELFCLICHRALNLMITDLEFPIGNDAKDRPADAGISYGCALTADARLRSGGPSYGQSVFYRSRQSRKLSFRASVPPCSSHRH